MWLVNIWFVRKWNFYLLIFYYKYDNLNVLFVWYIFFVLYGLLILFVVLFFILMKVLKKSKSLNIIKYTIFLILCKYRMLDNFNKFRL